MEFVTYRKFSEEDQAKALTDILQENHIEYILAEDRESLDSLYGDKQFSTQFYVKLQQHDFAKADTILTDIARQQLNAVDSNHYLFSFTNEELFDILAKPDEWNEFDYQLAQQILKQRNIEINEDTIELLKKQRVKELAKPEDQGKVWIYAGYIFAFFGGLLGVFIGLHLSSFRKTLPNGEQIYAFRKEDRAHGWRILIIGIVMFLVSVYIRLSLRDY